ncbi:FMRFamide-activated amiloride-sensitive sodium channel [Fasciola hepatica]|uniref:FMRFamide-activated amiloride-sensitive sodium channel n=1 Tax=Fasciola hepatica TaxID=6192 RepID=A0A4E0S2B3_FASHE|nr:FMRFamide-activated amiloride-sensitive sodium channel [Fasciola hepatica]
MVRRRPTEDWFQEKKTVNGESASQTNYLLSATDTESGRNTELLSATNNKPTEPDTADKNRAIHAFSNKHPSAPEMTYKNHFPSEDSQILEGSKPCTDPQTHLDTQPLLTQIRGQFRQFCETTSLRGVPRIVNTRDSKRRLLWVVFVAVFFVGCITCLTFIINQYLEFDVIHQPKKLSDSPRPFPSVTLCNLRPFSTRDIRKLKAAGVVPVDMYFENLKRMIFRLKSETRKHMTMLWTFAAYLSNLPQTVDQNDLGHSLGDIVKRCSILYKSGSLTRGTECTKSGFWEKTQDRVFHNCYTYTVFENRMNTTVNMEMVLYLDNLVEQTDCFDCQDRVMASQLTGARLLLHPRASYPRVAEDGINLMPGTLTDIRFSVNEWSMMEPPHGRCSRITPDVISFNRVNYSYSEEACEQATQQERIVERCNCLTQDLPVPTHLMNKGLKMCQDFKFPATHAVLNDLNLTSQLYFNDTVIDNYVHFAGCSAKTGTELDSQNIGCRPACLRYTYKPSITAAQWPTKTFLTWFVNKFLNEKNRTLLDPAHNLSKSDRISHQERFEGLHHLLTPYREISRLTNSGQLDEATDKLMHLQIVERNFLSIVISRPNFDLERVEEKAVVSLTSLFSQIGGLLSIWVGLTFVCIVELVELVLNVLDTILLYRQSKRIAKR